MKPRKGTYPAHWPNLAAAIKDRANWHCERCGHLNDSKTGHVLTVHHLDGNKANCADWNLAALCQRCHLHIQAKVDMDQMFFTEIIRVSPWFQRHLDGYLSSRKANKS